MKHFFYDASLNKKVKRDEHLMSDLKTHIEEDKIDEGILPAVKIMRKNGFETFESCEGGNDHAFAESIILFYGDEYDCLRAYEICEINNLNVDYVGRVFQKDQYKDGGVWSRPFNRIVFLKHPKTGTIFKPS